MNVSETWRDFVMPWGKHEGWTMFQVYKNDYDYCCWLANNCSNNEEVRAAAQAAVDHKNAVDPYSWS